MKLTNHQFEEAAYIFERANGYSHSDYEKNIIKESKLKNLSIRELEKIIVDGINFNIYKSEKERITAYWSLSKIGNYDLIPKFKKWLKWELKNNCENTIFQILVALDNLGEPAFDETRKGRTENEIDLNIRDAKKILQ
ncbi:hypothetical protein [Gramella sp. AN32]|uniref:Uncharacterized protein n=1 Tax=Christiangramia antarctica TaxID=2058158 RepID=A0ABW5X8G5_9FLAO|nr:hypothetical protein [Gramella sp. AN32]MCM4158157.1 hypothetical protein [Gramella sp. AN32]